jgi:hypothetical protein
MSRKRTVLKLTLLACMVLALALASPARAGDDNTIAGVLSGNPGCNVYSFDTSGGQILFAEAGAEFYQSKGRSSGGGCDHDDGTSTDTASVSEGSCTDGGTSDGGSDGGCSGDDGTTHDDGGCGCGDSTAGPNDLCLQVVDSSGTKICWAGRPVRPGWQRDPRLACHLEQGGDYFLRVFRGKCGSTAVCDGEAVTESGNPNSSPTHYLLRVRLVDVEDSEGKLFPPRKQN